VEERLAYYSWKFDQDFKSFDQVVDFVFDPDFDYNFVTDVDLFILSNLQVRPLIKTLAPLMGKTVRSTTELGKLELLNAAKRVKFTNLHPFLSMVSIPRTKGRERKRLREGTEKKLNPKDTNKNKFNRFLKLGIQAMTSNPHNQVVGRNFAGTTFQFFNEGDNRSRFRETE